MKRTVFLLVAAVFASAVGYAAQTLVGDQTEHRAGVISAALPSGWDVRQITSVSGRPVLFATKLGVGNTTTCALLDVDTGSLHVTGVTRVSCDAEDAPDEPIALVIEVVKGPYQMRAHIAEISPSGEATIGPAVMAIPYVSDTRPVWTEGGGSAWLYDVATPDGPLLLEISPTTGQVERRISIPVKLYRPIMVADSAGLWIGVTPGGASGAGNSPIYFVSSRTGKATLAWSGGVSDFWAYSDADAVWFAVNTRAGAEPWRLVRFDGTNPRPAENIAISGLHLSPFAPFGVVVGDGASSVWTLTWPDSVGEGELGCGSAEVERLDLSTGVAEIVGHLSNPTPDYYGGCNGLDGGQAVVIEDRLYVLTGQSQPLDPGQGYGRISSVEAPNAPSTS